MSSSPSATEPAAPRVLTFSQRTRRADLSRCHAYEMERVVTELTGGELWGPPPTRTSRTIERLSTRAGRRFRPALRLPRRATLPSWSDRFDLLLVVVQRPTDLVSLAALGDWRSVADRAVCYIEEVWTAEVESLRNVLALVADFDECFVSSANTIDELRRVTERSWRFLPFAVDAELFAPDDPTADRPLAVTNIGRRSPITHAALLEWADRQRRLYYFDSFSPARVKDPDEHRWLLANLMQRTSVAISNRGVGYDPTLTGRQEELAFRFFEAAAAGAVMVGCAPDTPVFSELFDWPDALLAAPFDAPDIVDIVVDLEADPDRVDGIRRRNVAESLRRHDHAHRWAEICAALDITPGGATVARTDRLSVRAGSIHPASADPTY